MLRTVGADELAELEALYSISPWGEERQDYRFALLLWCIARMMGDKTAKLQDFVLCPIDARKEQTSEDHLAAIRMIGSWFNANRR